MDVLPILKTQDAMIHVLPYIEDTQRCNVNGEEPLTWTKTYTVTS